MNKQPGKIKKFLNNLRYLFKDKKNIKIWKKEIQEEIADQNSYFHKYDLSISEDLMRITYIIELPENYQVAASDKMKLDKLMEYALNVDQYFFNIGWAEYLPYRPEFLYVESEVNEENKQVNKEMSCTYLAVWQFTPKIINNTTFWKEFAAFIGINSAIIASIVTSLCIIL